MALSKRRTRLVSFRMSDEEYEQLCSACAASRARSISELARTAVGNLTATAAETFEGQVARRISRLEESVADLRLQFQQWLKLPSGNASPRLRSEGVPESAGENPVVMDLPASPPDKTW